MLKSPYSCLVRSQGPFLPLHTSRPSSTFQLVASVPAPGSQPSRSRPLNIEQKPSSVTRRSRNSTGPLLATLACRPKCPAVDTSLLTFQACLPLISRPICLSATVSRRVFHSPAFTRSGRALAPLRPATAPSSPCLRLTT